MNFPTDEEIDNLETGDIVTVPISEEGYALNRNIILDGKKYFDSKWFFLGKDLDDDFICLFMTSDVDIAFDFRSVGQWLTNGEDQIRFSKILNKIPLKDLDGLDINKSRYFSFQRIIGIEKKVIKLPEPVGMNCCECNEYYHYAVSNLSMVILLVGLVEIHISGNIPNFILEKNDKIYKRHIELPL